MNLIDHLRRCNGATQTSALVEAGYSRHRIKHALASGRLIRPRRGWVALPNADPGILFAARNNVVLSCITQAKRLGLWVLSEDRPHVSARSTGSRSPDPRSITHWNVPLLDRDPSALEDPIENVLALVSRCQPHDSALSIIDSALNKGLTTCAALATLPIPSQMRSLLKESTPFSDSGIETMFRTRLRWLRQPIRSQVWILGHRVDFLIGDRLIVQVDGRQHVGAQRSEDIKHDALLGHEGYYVIRVSYEQIVYRWHEVSDAIIGAIARGMHLAR